MPWTFVIFSNLYFKQIESYIQMFSFDFQLPVLEEWSTNNYLIVFLNKISMKLYFVNMFVIFRSCVLKQRPLFPNGYFGKSPHCSIDCLMQGFQRHFGNISWIMGVGRKIPSSNIRYNSTLAYSVLNAVSLVLEYCRQKINT